MARRKRTRTKSLKRYPKRRKMYMPLTKAVGMPERMFVKLKYCDEVQFTSGIVSELSQVYRGNSIFDPDFTGAGHQPLGHDQWAGFYKRYRVVACAISCKFTQFTTAGNTHHIVVLPSNESTVDNFQPSCEQVGSVTGTTSSSNGKACAYLRSFVRTSDIKGSTNLANDKDLEALFGNNPNIQWFWQIIVKSAFTVDVDIRALVELTYYVECYDRVQLATS